MRSAALGVLLMPAISSAGSLELTLNRTVIAHHSYVTIGELVTIQGGSEDAQRIQGQRIKLHAGAGGYMYVSRERINGVIKASSHDVNVVWQGPRFVEVRFATKTVTGEQVVDAAVGHLRRLAAHDGMEVVLKTAGEPGTVVVPSGEVILRARRVSRGWRPRTRVEVELWVDDVMTRTLPVWIDVSMVGQGLVATRALARGTDLKRDDVRAAQVELLGLRGRPAVAPGPDERLRVKRSLAEGEVVCETDLQRRPLVVRGDEVRGKFDEAGITVEVAGLAADDGDLGERIRIQRRDDSSALFFGVVTGKGMVAIYE